MTEAKLKSPNPLQWLSIIQNAFRVIGALKKSGWKTTEFWLVAITAIASIVFAFTGALNPQVAVIVAGVLVAVYAAARAYVKSTPSKADDALLQAVKDALGKFGVSLPDDEEPKADNPPA